METLIRTVFIGLIALLLTAPAWARDAQGNLDLIITPNDGRPAILTPSAAFTITLREKAQLTLVSGEQSITLSPEWKVINDHRVEAVITLASKVPEGMYTLQATQGDTTDVHEGAIVLLHNTPEKIAVYMDDTPTLWVQLSETLSIPIALPKTGKSFEYEQRYGTLPFALDVGEFGLIIFDGQDTRASRMGQLYPLVRSLKAKPWTIAISTTPCANLPFRTQLTLFSDDPIGLFLSPDTLPKAYTQWTGTRFHAYPTKNNPIRLTPSHIGLPNK